MKREFEELEIDSLYFRDRWQFELKSEFLPSAAEKEHHFNQEFYIFIPQALQVNSDSYPKGQFYRDQTNLIRLKTPLFSLQELANLNTPSSPLGKIWNMRDHILKTEEEIAVIKDLKLVASIVRSYIRRIADKLIDELEKKKYTELKEQIHKLKQDIQAYQASFDLVQTTILEKNEKLQEHFRYIKTFSEQTYNQFLIILLHDVRENKLSDIDEELTSLLIHQVPKPEAKPEMSEDEGERFIYQKSLLNKYVVDALLLEINRFSPSLRYRNLISGLAAGIAMLIYILFVIVWGRVFVLNSEPFLFLTVVIYILKDRIKEAIKDLSHHGRLGWLSDYTTEIKSSDETQELGTLKEKVSFVNEENVPEEIMRVRNREFHSTLERFKRPETILYYKKNMTIYQKPKELDPRYFMLNVIFRFNVRHFLDKASNPAHHHLWVDDQTKEIVEKQFPKVYHINIILKSTIKKQGETVQVELHKYRLIVDKNGIKRIENL